MSSRQRSLDRDRLGALFERALELDPRERASFLERVCAGDPQLHAELTSLLGSHAMEPAFLERLRERVLPAVLGSLSSEIPPGARIAGRYEIVERLGVGGMGVVYKARDATLERLVALKFLPPHRSADFSARARFRREARAASALDHPNIAVVHDIGAIDPAAADPEAGGLFIAMAYYPGETLKQRIARGPLPIDEAIRHAVQLADALAVAHQIGIVHRDIKPANVLVTDRGLIKVVDFGVAVVVNAAPAREAAVTGTVAYMSPEQTRGGPIDHRTDIWSLGVVLYEMLTGRRPFRGQAEALVYGIRHDAPVPLDSLRPDAPPGLARIVDRCLAKDPSSRYATAAAMLTDLDAVAGGEYEPGEQSIVVLPFTNAGGRPEDDYLGDGLMDELIGDLSRIRALRVISRPSAMRLRGHDKDVRTIARELGVRYLLEGVVRRAGDALRITVRLIDAHRDEQVCSRQFDRTAPDLFEIAKQVARAVVNALRVPLGPGETQLLVERPISDERAYEAYLRARFEAWSFSAEGLERAERHIKSALAIAGDNELLYATLGHIAAMKTEAGLVPVATIDRVEALADQVFTLNPHSARGHFLKMWGAFHRGDVRGAMHAGERARALEPNNPDTLLLLGYVHAHAGRNADARTLLQHALALDPLTPLTQGVQGFVAIMEGRFGDAIEPYRRCHAMDPDSPFGAGCLGWALAYDRRLDEAIAVLDAAGARFPGTAFAAWFSSLAHGLRGDSAAALGAITPKFVTAAHNSEMFARFLATCYALAGEKDRALDWLERAVDLGMLNYAYLAHHDWFLDGLRNEPRFHSLLERVRRASADLA